MFLPISALLLQWLCSASYDKVINLAKQGLNNDDKGYRREFIRLVEAAKGLERTNKN